MLVHCLCVGENGWRETFNCCMPYQKRGKGAWYWQESVAVDRKSNVFAPVTCDSCLVHRPAAAFSISPFLSITSTQQQHRSPVEEHMGVALGLRSVRHTTWSRFPTYIAASMVRPYHGDQCLDR
ncbi:unnamed protein product, partial [Ectocarpus sp. 12 AP-2014]